MHIRVTIRYRRNERTRRKLPSTPRRALSATREMSFGLKNVGATFQRLMDKIFANQIGRNIEVYVDDMIVKSRPGNRVVSFRELPALVKSSNEETLLHGVQETFKTLAKAQMKLNRTKCTFGLKEDTIKGVSTTISVDPLEPEAGKELCKLYTDGVAKYEALLEVLKLAKEVGAKQLATLNDSILITNQINGTYEEKDPRMQKYLDPVYDPEEARKVKIRASNFAINDNQLYQRGYLSPWLKCISKIEGQTLLEESHSGDAAAHEGARALTVNGLKKRLLRSKSTWVYELPTVLWSYRTTVRSSMGEMPLSLTYGMKAVLPLEIVTCSMRTESFEETANEEGRCQDLDLLDEKHDATQIRQTQYKSHTENYYNCQV
uniref:Reverse transcriptase domain-containing protein n=1 Tax=Lactuca sativa TaxID=4236 RepID=A0A9R1VBD8_LACSA|nr:hypothetical protein LSAT_V11C500271210 [Lactuca sativa]